MIGEVLIHPRGHFICFIGCCQKHFRKLSCLVWTHDKSVLLRAWVLEISLSDSHIARRGCHRQAGTPSLRVNYKIEK